MKHFVTIILFLPLQHDGRERKQGWFLDEIQVTNPRKPQTWTFPCYQWLSLYESDCQVRRCLKPLVHKKAEKVGKHNVLDTNMIVEELICITSFTCDPFTTYNDIFPVSCIPPVHVVRC